jgi:translation initiation factor 2 subunit 2
MDNNINYSLNELLDRCYTEIDNIKNNNNSNKLLLIKPDVVFMNKKTYVRNFYQICSRMKKTDQEIKTFFEIELKTDITIDSNKMLIISGRFNQLGVENIFSKYVEQFMKCSECSSSNTEIIKENRINFMKCNSCFAKKSIVL